MKIGLVSAILDGWDYRSMIDIISRLGYESVEIACWPRGAGERRYAGVSHIDVENLDEEKKEDILAYAREKKVEISALAFYPNTMASDIEKRTANIEHLKKVIDASAFLGVNLVTTFIGRDQNKNLEENLEIFKTVWPPILEYARYRGVRIAIENCPMLFGSDQWPGGQNLFTSPYLWDRMFELAPYDNFGIAFDPSHFIWQHMDYIRPIYQYKDRIFHVHFKDIKLYQDRLDYYGMMSYPLDYMAPKLPGLGDVKWAEFVSALYDIGYNASACIEVEDRAFESSQERILDSLILSVNYMKNYVI